MDHGDYTMDSIWYYSESVNLTRAVYIDNNVWFETASQNMLLLY